MKLNTNQLFDTSNIDVYDPMKVSYFGHQYQYQINCHDINKTTIFTNDPKNSERVARNSHQGATQIEFELFDEDNED